MNETSQVMSCRACMGFSDAVGIHNETGGDVVDDSFEFEQGANRRQIIWVRLAGIVWMGPGALMNDSAGVRRDQASSSTDEELDAATDATQTRVLRFIGGPKDNAAARLERDLMLQLYARWAVFEEIETQRAKEASLASSIKSDSEDITPPAWTPRLSYYDPKESATARSLLLDFKSLRNRLKQVARTTPQGGEGDSDPRDADSSVGEGPEEDKAEKAETAEAEAPQQLTDVKPREGTESRSVEEDEHEDGVTEGPAPAPPPRLRAMRWMAAEEQAEAEASQAAEEEEAASAQAAVLAAFCGVETLVEGRGKCELVVTPEMTEGLDATLAALRNAVARLPPGAACPCCGHLVLPNSRPMALAKRWSLPLPGVASTAVEADALQSPEQWAKWQNRRAAIQQQLQLQEKAWPSDRGRRASWLKREKKDTSSPTQTPVPRGRRRSSPWLRAPGLMSRFRTRRTILEV